MVENKVVAMKPVSPVTEALRKEAQINEVFNSVCHEFALRHRTRNQITVSGLAYRMKKAGFGYPKEAYAPVLKFLASLDFGKLTVDSKGRPAALRDVKTTLQSIGEVAVGMGDGLTRYRPRNKFRNLERQPRDYMVERRKTPRAEVIKAAEIPVKKAFGKPITITVQMNNSPVVITLPKDLSTDEMAVILNKFKD